jgi:O-antigen/teichoic acid export membrane protein
MKAVLHSLASVVGGEAAVRVANFAAIVFIARKYGQTTLGAYSVALAAITVVVMFADGGLQTSAITQLSVATPARNQIFGRLTFSKTVLLVAAVLLLALTQAWSGQSHLLFAIGFWITLRAVVQSYSQLQMAVLKSLSLAKWIAVIQTLHSAVLLSGIWLSFARDWSIFTLLKWMNLAQLLEFLLGFAVLLRSGAYPRWPKELRFFATLKAAAPYAIVYGLANLIIRADTVILSIFVSLAQIGSFSAANTILLVVYVCSWLFGSVLLPEMVRLSNNLERQRLYAKQWARWVTLVAVPSVLLISLAAPTGIVLLYGSAFAQSGMLASLMVLACPLILLNSIYTTFAIATNNRRALIGIYGAGAFVTLGLDFALARAFGSTGIVVAIVIRESVMLLGLWLMTSYFPSRRLSYGSQLLQEGIETNPPA